MMQAVLRQGPPFLSTQGLNPFMPLYLDSADVKDVKQALNLGFVTGVTTNPSLIARTGRPGLDVLKDILALTKGIVFYQVTADDVHERAAQARQASGLDRARVMVKIPATTENLTLAAQLGSEGILCAITAVSSPAQAYLSTLVGALYIAPYVNRLTRELGDGIAILRDCVAITKGSRTKVIAASLKTPDEVVAAVLAGADDITIPLDLMMQMGEHELSNRAIEEFSAAMRAAAKVIS
jgi:transaldolase